MKWSLCLIAVMLAAVISCNKSNGTYSSQTTSFTDTSANIITYQIEGASPQITFSAPSIFAAPSINDSLQTVS